MKRIKKEKGESEAWAISGDFISHHLIPLKRLFCNLIGAGPTYEDFYAVWFAQSGTGTFNSVIAFLWLRLYQTVAVIIVTKQTIPLRTATLSNTGNSTNNTILHCTRRSQSVTAYSLPLELLQPMNPDIPPLSPLHLPCCRHATTFGLLILVLQIVWFHLLDPVSRTIPPMYQVLMLSTVFLGTAEVPGISTIKPTTQSCFGSVLVLALFRLGCTATGRTGDVTGIAMVANPRNQKVTIKFYSLC